ncbi:MAG: TIGR00730 family Rossman fold protein [Epsilonproteobacteria bacterium]|nr:TIGR00730 family Rossman fold protein [Campylobacterota bacterium]
MHSLSKRFKEYSRFLKSLAITNYRLLTGMWQLTKLPQPAITVFGGSRIERDSPFALKAQELAKKLAANHFSIITGGGPGIMEAANRGAMDYLNECKEGQQCPVRLVSAGIGLINLNVERKNEFLQESIIMNHFFARKWLLTRYSVGFAIFPGGFGTFDELFEILTLVQCNRMEKTPIVLIDRDYWGHLNDWITKCTLKHGLIDPNDQKLFTITDSVDEAFDIFKTSCATCTESVVRDEEREQDKVEKK